MKIKDFALVISYLLLAGFGCETKKQAIVNCKGVTLKRVYTDLMGNNGRVSYSHYLLLENYSDECYDDVSFSKLAKNYVDSCLIKKPVDVIHFITSEEGVDFESREPDFDKLKKYEAISFGMDVNSDSAIIEKVYFVRNGVYKTIEFNQCNWRETAWR